MLLHIKELQKKQCLGSFWVMEKERDKQSAQRIVLCVAGAIALFVLDLMLPLSLVLFAPYLLILLLIDRFGEQRDVVLAAVSVSGLAAMDTIWHRAELDWQSGLLQLLGLSCLWFVAVLLQRDPADKNGETQVTLETWLESAPDAMLIVDAHGDIVLANRQAESLFGYSEHQLLGAPVHTLVPEALREQHRGHVAAYVASPRKREMGSGLDLLALKRDGGTLPVEISLSPLLAAGEHRVVVSIRDVSQQKEHESELMRINTELENFAYVASHDLKAPLRVIDNASRWLVEDLGDKLAGDDLENLGLLRQRAQRMERFLDDLLEYSRIGRRLDDRYSEQIRASDMLEDAIFMLAVPPGFTIEREGDWQTVQVYRMPIQHILSNLLGNAIKHHDKPQGVIRVGLTESEGFFHLSVSDDGPGIDPAFHEKIFDMFQTLKPRDRVEGSGMGLAIVKKIVSTFGGRISVESSPGQGSTFRVDWPKTQTAIRRKGAAL